MKKFRKLFGTSTPTPKGNKMSENHQAAHSMPNTTSNDRESPEDAVDVLPISRKSGSRTEEYLKAICFDRTTIEKAMTAAKNSAQDLDPKQHQASQLRIDRALNQWSADKRSQALLILKSTKLENGFLRCSASCARLFNAPAYTPPHRIVLGWFCDYFKNSSVHQVALDLYGQLLSNAPPKTFDIDSSYQPSVELESLLKLLEGQILYQLRHTPVYCFVDSINAYDEDEGKRSKLSSLLKTLATIVETRSPYPFKLLITTSYPCCAEDTVESPKCLVVWDDET